MKTINTVHIKNTVMLASMLALVSSVFSASDSTDHVTYHPEGAASASAVNKTRSPILKSKATLAPTIDMMDAKMKAMKGSMGMMGGQQGKYAGAMKDNMPADMGARL